MINIFLSCFFFAFVALQCIANPPDLGALTVLNLTTDLNVTFPGTSIVNITNALEDRIRCFRQSLPQESPLSRTNFIDCFNAEKKIAAHDTHRPIHFRRNDETTFVLPNTFTYRTCVIFVNMISAEAEDFFYVGQIRDVAIDTARRCTAFPPALGGKGIVGPKRLMEVFVLGRAWPYENGGMDTVLLDGHDTVA